MSTLTPRTPEQNEYEISGPCIAEFNKLSQQRQIRILKQLSINARSFTQYVFNEKRSLFSDVKQMVDDSKRANQLRESNARQIERKYGEIIRELYVEKISIKTIAVNLGKLEQIENADSELNISESIIRSVVKSMNIQRADDRNKGKHKVKKRNVKRSLSKMSGDQQIAEQIVIGNLADNEQIKIADVEQMEKQIDPEIDNVRLEDLGDDS